MNPVIIENLKKVSFFKMFARDDAVMEKIAGMCVQRKIKKGKTVIRESEYGDELFIIMNGQIEILKKTIQNELYTVTSLDASAGGVYVGELAMIDNDIRSATVMAKTDCDCLIIKRNKFIKFGDENPRLGLEITRAIAVQLGRNLRKTNSDVITLFSALVEEIASEEV